MESAYIHRVHLIVPVYRISDINQYIKENIDPAGGDWLTANLSPTGEPPFDHAQFSAGLTEDQFSALQTYLQTPPTIPDQPRHPAALLLLLLKPISIVRKGDPRPRMGKEGEPVAVAIVDDNTGEWTDPAETLDSLGLSPPSPPQESTSTKRKKKP